MLLNGIVSGMAGCLVIVPFRHAVDQLSAVWTELLGDVELLRGSILMTRNKGEGSG